MNARRILFAAALAALATPALARNAEDYFHGASYKYVEGKRQEARLEVEEGLRKYPNDPRLQGLASQLRDLQDRDDKDKNSGKGDDQDKKDNDKKESGKDKDKEKDKKPEDDKKKDEGKNEQDKQQPPEDKPGNEKNDGKDGKNPGGARPGEMSPEEAQRLLNAFAEDEKKEQRERQKLLRKRLETEQDW